MTLEKYAVLNGEVVNRFTGNKSRGTFEIRQGKNKISIYKITKRNPQGKFVGYAGKMGKRVQKRAEKLQQTRIKKAQNKALKQFNAQVRALNEFNRQEQERQALKKSEEEQARITIDDEDKPKDKLSLESIREIANLKSSGLLLDFDEKLKLDVPVILSRDAQNMLNFSRVLDSMKRDGTITMEKIENLFKSQDIDATHFPRPPRDFETIEEFTNWLLEEYRDATTKDRRTQLWDMLHSLYPEKGYTYNPLRF